MENFLKESMDYLAREDGEVSTWLRREYQRQQENIELIASENITSPAVMAAMGSCLTNKNAEGYPGRRYYGGCEYVDEIERLAIDRAKALFGAEHANVQPHSGAQANLAAYAALLQPGDTLVGMDLSGGGHLTHGASVNQSGKLYRAVSYGVDPRTGRIDYDRVEDIVKEARPKLLVAGASAYPRALDFKAFADIAHRYGALLMVDMAHIAGLVAGGQHESTVAPFFRWITPIFSRSALGMTSRSSMSAAASFTLQCFIRCLLMPAAFPPSGLWPSAPAAGRWRVHFPYPFHPRQRPRPCDPGSTPRRRHKRQGRR